jgi:hypothetical protein
MSLKKFVAALALTSAAAFAWLGLSAGPAAAAPQGELKQLDQELTLHAKKNHKKGLKHTAKATAGTGVQNSAHPVAAKMAVQKLHRKGLKHAAKATARGRVRNTAGRLGSKIAKTGAKKHHKRHHAKSKKA